jgi:hypothetical protein
MKTFLQPVLYGCLAIAGSITYAQAQDLAVAGNRLKDDPSFLQAITSSPVAATAMPATRVSPKVTRLFNKY